MQVVLSIVIDRPIDLVFRAFADIDFVTRVDPNTLSAKLIRGQPFSNGACYDMLFQGVISKIYGTYTFTQYDPPKQFIVDVGVKKAPGTEITSFETVGNGTKVTWDGRYALKWYMIPVYFIMRAMVIRKGNKWMGLMKTAIESGQYDAA